MGNIVRAEYQKTGRSMRRRLIWAFPAATFLLAYALTSGMANLYAVSVWNWWYTLLLPCMTALLCCLSMAQEKKVDYYNLTTCSADKRKLMLGKVICIGGMILASNMILFAGASLGGFLFAARVPAGGAAAAALLLTVTQLWEIPVFLFLGGRFGTMAGLCICLFLTVGGTVFSQTGKWYLLVSAIPVRIMCPLLHILPNGIPAEAGDPMLDMAPVAPGVCLSVLWFVFALVLFLNWFDKSEGKPLCL